MLRTTRDVTIKFMDYGKITVPSGTRVTHNTALGYDENYCFVDDFSWIKDVDGIPQYGLLHDAKYYGINIPKEFVEDID